MLGGAFAAFTVSAGIMHSYAIFLLALIEEFRWSRAETSVAYSVSQLVAGGSSPLVGAMVDRLGPRRLLTIGGSLLFLGLLGSALISSLWQNVLLYGIVMTIGANCLGLVVFVPLLSRRFERRRGMAISIVQSANGFGRAASAPLVQLSISSDRLARDLSGAGRVCCSMRAAARAVVSPCRPLSGAGGRSPRNRRRSPARGPARRRLDAGRSDTHAAFLAALRRLSVHRAWQLSGVAAPARLRGGCRVRQALCRGRSRHRQLSRDPRHDPHRHPLGLYRARMVGDPGLRLLDLRGGLRIADREPRPALAVWLHACFFGLTWGARGPAITAKTADLFPGASSARSLA